MSSINLQPRANTANEFAPTSFSTKNLTAFALFSALVGLSPYAAATDLTLGQTAGTNNIAIGKDSFASGANSQAIGNKAIATGANLTPAEFEQELKKIEDLLQQIEQAKAQIRNQQNSITDNQELQRNIERNIQLYTNLLANAQYKLGRINDLTNEKNQKQGELDTANGEVSNLENAMATNQFTSGSKADYLNFLKIINGLDWNKLDQPNGRDELANDLKQGIEKDLPNIQFDKAQYEELITGYVNAQGNISAYEPTYYNKLDATFGYSYPQFYDLGSNNSSSPLRIKKQIGNVLEAKTDKDLVNTISNESILTALREMNFRNKDDFYYYRHSLEESAKNLGVDLSFTLTDEKALSSILYHYIVATGAMAKNKQSKINKVQSQNRNFTLSRVLSLTPLKVRK